MIQHIFIEILNISSLVNNLTSEINCVTSEHDLKSLYSSTVNTPLVGAVGIFDFILGSDTTLNEKPLRLS